MSSADSLDRASLFDCTGLVVVITGGGTGIGCAMARALSCNGATVYILGRRLDKLISAADSTKNAPSSSPPHKPNGKIIPLQCDVTSKTSLEAATSRIASTTGYVNLVIANAGIMGPNNNALLPRSSDTALGPLTIQEAQAHLWATPIEEVTEVYKVNVAGALYTVIAFLGLLDEGNKNGNVRQTSQVLITSSIGGFHRSWPQAGLAYTTSKAAVTHLVKSLASFFVQWKLRVNGLAPGLFPSEMMQAVFGNEDMTIEGAIPKNMQPLGRAGSDEEMAGTVLYFASKAGAYCSGTIHVVDGGRLGVQPGATY